jgi:hypothetical protein
MESTIIIAVFKPEETTLNVIKAEGFLSIAFLKSMGIG